MQLHNYQHSLSDGDSLKQILATDQPVIVEVGCNDGADSRKFLDLFPRCRLYCFEVDPRAIAQFKASIDDPRCVLREMAICDKIGEATFYQSGGTTAGASKQDWDMSGSLNKPTGHLQHSPWCTFDKTITVPTTTLDFYLLEVLNIPRIDLLWLDVQGGERKVIDGGLATLKFTHFVYAEYCQFKTPSYDGSMSLKETIAALGPDWQPICTHESYNVFCKNKRFT